MSRQLISVTCAALCKLKNIINTNNYNAIRFSLKGGGCNGFEYKLEPTNNLSKKEEYFSQNGVDIHICDKSLLYLIGTEIDWKKDIMGEAFVFNNPNAQNTCGCGTSFNPFSN